MKKRSSDEQLINIHHEAEAGVSAPELYRKHAISDAAFYTGARSMAVWRCPRLNA